MASVSQLGYLGLGVSDAKAWQDLATTILGMQVVPGDDPSTSYLRMDEYHHRLELRSRGSDDLEFVGWDGRTIDDTTWQIEHYTAVDSLWGHAQLRDLVTGMALGEK